MEAGGPSQWLNGVPGTAAYWMGSDYDWKYAFEPSSKASLAMENGVMKKPRGKVLGGSSMLNWMIHIRGHSGDYDEWENLGNKGWSYKFVTWSIEVMGKYSFIKCLHFRHVLPRFKRFQNFVGDVENKDKYHGMGGLLGVMPTAYVQVRSYYYILCI